MTAPQDAAAMMSIREITANITTFSAPFSRLGLFKVGGRGTLVRLQNDTFAIFSPVALTPSVRETLGSSLISYIIAPDFEHHIFVSEWARAFPKAKVIGVEGLPEKRAGMPEHSKHVDGVPPIKFDTVFTQANRRDLRIDEAFDAEFEYEYVPSHSNKELVFLHKADGGSLIEADLIFNLPATEQYSKVKGGATTGLMTKFFNGIMHTQGEAIWHRRFLWYAAGSKDREGLAESAKKIDGWQFERMIPCHGNVIESGAKDVFRRVMAWQLQGKK